MAELARLSFCVSADRRAFYLVSCAGHAMCAGQASLLGRILKKLRDPGWLLSAIHPASRFTPAEGILEVLKCLLFSRHEVNAEHVEANRRRAYLGQLAHVLAGQAAESVALVRVNCDLGRTGIASGPALYFDEAQHRPLPGDQVPHRRAGHRRPAPRNHGINPCGADRKMPRSRLRCR